LYIKTFFIKISSLNFSLDVFFMAKKNIDFIFQTLDKLYPNADTELKYQNGFQLLLAVIMSAQATDKQVNKVTDKLFKTVFEPRDVLEMGLDKFTKAISSINYYKTKAKNIYATCEILDKNPEILSSDLKSLTTLPWVGIKTAKVVSHVLFWTKVIAVDTHVHRVSNRLWLVNTKVPEKTSESLEKIVPDKYKSIAHHGLILFWRYHCTARNPKCQNCPFKDFCKFFNS